MGERVIESMPRSNGKASFSQVLHTIETHQTHEEVSSSSCSAQCGVDKLKHCSHTATRGTKRCNSPAESSISKKKSLPSRGATYDWEDIDSTQSPPQINAAKSDREKRSVSSLIYSTPPASSGPFEPLDTPAVAAANPRPVDDDPIYHIGDMKIYDQTQKAIPKLYESRWQVIRPEIFDRVHNRLGRGRFAVRLNKRKHPAIIELMSAGVTKATLMPAVVVVIPKHIKAMQDFLDTDSTVQNRCKPEDGTTVELLAFACKGSSTLIGMPSDSLGNDSDLPSDTNSGYVSDGNDSLSSADESNSSAVLHSLTDSSVLEVDAQSVSVVHNPNKIDGDVRHGMGIRLVTKDGSRYVRGTCGGLLQLMIPNQPPRQVGLMAGHLLEQLGQDSKEREQKNTDSSLIIGDMIHPKSSGSLPRYDWALFDATKLGFEQNMANQNSLDVVQRSEFPDVNTMVVVRTPRGEVTGTLSSSSSGIMLNPDQGFVHVRTIMMNKDSILTKGDSGAWVFQRGYEKVYGYIIATNGNDHAYMVPLHAAIAEIQMTLGAVSVSLAISTDPDRQVRSRMIHEHVEQTKRSMLFLEEEDPIRSAIMELNDGQPEEMISAASLLKQSPREQSRQKIQSQLGPQYTLAKAYLKRGHVLEAIEMLERVVKHHEDVLGPDHASCLASKHELGVAYTENGQTTNAIRILQHVVKTEAVVPENSEFGRLASQHELARAFLADGQVTEAVKLLEDVVAAKASILKRSNQYLLVSQHELSRAYLENGQALEAVELLKDVVAVQASILRQLDPRLLMSQQELAKAYLAGRREPEAIKLLEEVVAGKPPGNSDPQLLALQTVLGEAYLRVGRASDAVNILEHVVAVATATSTSQEHREIRVVSLQWLRYAREQRYGVGDVAEDPGVSDSLVTGTSDCVYSHSVDALI